MEKWIGYAYTIESISQNETIPELLTITRHWEEGEQNCIEFPCSSTPNTGTKKSPNHSCHKLDAIFANTFLQAEMLSVVRFFSSSFHSFWLLLSLIPAALVLNLDFKSRLHVKCLVMSMERLKFLLPWVLGTLLRSESIKYLLAFFNLQFFNSGEAVK